MLSPDYLKALGEQIEIMYASLEDDIIADIVRRLMSTKLEMTQSAVWQSEVLQTTGVLRQDVISRVARATRKNEKKIEQIFEEGGLETLRYDDEVYKRAGLNPLPIKQSPAMLQILIASAKKCNNEIKNLTRTSAATASTGLRRILDKAYMQVISGGFDYNTAIRRAVKQAGKEGIKVVYPSGGTAQLDVAIRRAVVTGVNQTAGEIQKMRIEEMGTKLVETSAHFGARPDHAEWQGQVFYYKEPVEGYESFVDITHYGSGDGLMGWNCRHSFFPFFKGISKRAYTDDELKQMKEHTVKYNGKEYTDYKASQMQRRMEREIRATKREILALDKARNSVGISQELKDSLNSDYNMASVVLARKNEQLADFLEQTGRGEDRARLLVDGFDRSHAQVSVWAARKSSGKTVDISEERGIMNMRSDTVALENQRYGRNKNTVVNKTYIDSGEYRRKFDKISDNQNVNRAVYNAAKTALKHRSGTELEDMYWIDGDTGKIIAKEINSVEPRKVYYSDATKKNISAYKHGNVITIHTHPSSMPPSVSDFNSCFNNNYKCGYVVCHNGKLYAYESRQNLSERLYDAYLGKFIRQGLDEFDAQFRTLEKLKENYDIDFWEVT